MVFECKNLSGFIADIFYYCCSFWSENGHLFSLVLIWPFKSLREKLSSGHETLFLWQCWTFWTRYLLLSVQAAGTLSFAYLSQLLHNNNNPIFWSGSCRNLFFFPLDYFSKSLADSSYNISQRPVCLLKLNWKASEERWMTKPVFSTYKIIQVVLHIYHPNLSSHFLPCSHFSKEQKYCLL